MMLRTLLLGLGICLASGSEDGDNDNMWPMVGIDLGTTFSAVGIFRDGQVEIIPNDMGNRITPSMVAFNKDERLIGDAALNQISANPENTVYAIKRLIGRKFMDMEVQRDITSLSFKVVSDKSKEDKPLVQVTYQGQKKTFTPEEISAMVLHKMKAVAEAFIGQNISNAVVTVPAYFNDAQRQSTKDAGTISGLNVRRIINEPTAAAIAYGLNKKGENKILVYDFGGGTFDVSLLTIDDGFFEVVATNGNTHLGGEDMDNRLVKHFSAMLRKKEKIDISDDKKAMARLRRACEAAKRQLSSSPEARVEVDGIASGYDLSEKITRAKFEELVMDLLQGTLDPVKAVLKDADWKPEDVDEIVLVGGSSRIPKVQELIEKLFGGKKPHKGINPDEAVAYGAAVQAAVLAGAQGMDDRVLLVDVCPLSLGIETVGGVMSKIIPRNTQIPARGTKIVSTNSDNQEKLKIQVFEGERPFTKNNRPLGSFELRGIPPAPRNTPKIEVAFELDENGILQVTAHDKKAGIKEQITITNDKGTLTDDEIQRMLAEAEQFATADKEAQEQTALRNDLESWMYRIRNQFDDEEHLINKLEADKAEQISNAQRETVEWLDTHPAATKEELMAKYKDLEALIYPIMEALYKEHQLKAPAAEGEEGGTDSGEEEGDPTEL